MCVALHQAAWQGDLDTVRRLVESRVDVETTNGSVRHGATCLIEAAGCGHVDMVNWLLSVRANPETQDDYGVTALMAAVIVDSVECVSMLLDAGSDVEARNEDGHTALSLGVSNDSPSCAELLRDHDAKTIVLTAHMLQRHAGSKADITFTNMAGDELAVIQVDPSVRLSSLARAVRKGLDGQPPVKLMLPDGRVLGPEYRRFPISACVRVSRIRSKVQFKTISRHAAESIGM